MYWRPTLSISCESDGPARESEETLGRKDRKGDARAVAAMLGDERFSVDVNTAMDDGNTPLFIASQEGHSEVVSMLLAPGAGQAGQGVGVSA